MTIINKTMVPLNQYGVPCADALSYPSRSSSSSIVEGTSGTFYIKKSSQGLYLVEAKMKSDAGGIGIILYDRVLAWNWSFVQTTNLCDLGITIYLYYVDEYYNSLMKVCPTVQDVNSYYGLSYNENGSESFDRELFNAQGAFSFYCQSNYPTNVTKVVIDGSFQGEVFFSFSTYEGKNYILILSGDGSGMNLSFYDEVFYDNEATFPVCKVISMYFGSYYSISGIESSFSFRDISFYSEE